MKRFLVVLACCAALTFTRAQAQDVGPLPVIEFVRPLVTDSTALAPGCAGSGLVSVPMQCFTFTDSKSAVSRTIQIVGRSPFNRGKASTAVKVMIVPIVLTIGTTVFDPTTVDTCFAPGTATTVSLFQNSPILQNVAWDSAGGAGHGALMNGVNTGTTTFNDANRRAEFWSFVGGSNYHTTFSVTTHAPVTVSAATVATIGGGAVLGSGCSTLGGLYLNPAGPGGDWDFYVQNTIIPSLGIGADTFPVFLMKNVIWSLQTPPSFSSNCCVLGYHGAFTSGGNLWTYSPLDFDTSGDFGAGVHDTSVAAHEVGEWLDDPTGANPTPAWGGIGQVGGCQGNWEVGDPLSGTFVTPVVMPNGYTYQLQELAFFSWFYNAQLDPSIGTGGKFSTKGTFGGPSKACPAGGTF